VLDLLQNRARRDELGAAARAFAQKYDWSLIVPQLEALYAES
jgi:glycosyltransferase involved in cell wall biosynthesis